MMRINRFLSEAGVCSRREADRLAASGRIMVDGMPAEPGMKVSDRQEVTLDGRIITKNSADILIAVNKPRGIVCTCDSKREKNNIVDFVGFPQRIYPIGRLDRDSDGLLLMTNDGELMNSLIRSGPGHEKEYIVRVNRRITDSFIRSMSSGVPILDTVTRKCKVKRVDDFTFSIILTQGLNRQIRRMCEYFDYKVTRLTRIRIMNIKLGTLKTGTWRNVTDREQKELRRLLNL